MQTKGKRGTERKQTEVPNQETKDLPAESGETKNKENPGSDEEGEKEVWLISYTMPYQWSLFPFLYSPEEYFFQLLCKCKFLVALETFLRKRNPGIPWWRSG